MENAFDAISQLVLCITSLVYFVIVIKMLIPRVSLKINYSLDKLLGRGYKKYRYPSGRAVVYEPHPSVRKYINKYALFVNDGYKYLKCCLDAGVKTLKFEIIMLNNRDEVIDVLSVNTTVANTSETKEILLHPDTSYVALNLDSVNGFELKKENYSYYTLRQLIVYFGLVLFTVFIEMLIAAKTLGVFLSFVLRRTVVLTSASALYFLLSIAVAVIAVILVAIFSAAKGIGVGVNGKK